ncbi:actin-related protein 6-like [Teleopsis dalmanni]|uniref:actin-related protein 6-like n=1 Tax=Teleopsis dalmanni TaxID=139649 RepID=UPI0018CD81E5|nr:actin-related protein 6-like [Teleopsis dalmanni]XP_037935368.1 actin-related protein 6-like [Teleopsis dalmanni]XP_037935376.1 actin-related protein 6-like [Teleopsis dalmanni]XP_037935377.1 actin-related protein 6-like [Teleopsis dalmanni]
MDDAVAVVLDNGAYTAKVGLATQDEPFLIPNCTMKAKAERRRIFVGNQIDECRDASSLFYQLPFQKGYLMDWEIERIVWDHIFSADGTGILLEDRPIIITEPMLNFPQIQEAMVEILFEDYHCSGVHKTTTAELAAYNYAAESEETPINSLNCIVVDVGYSFTHVVPFVKGKIVMKGVRRMDIGGKSLTNHMKELISYRQLNMMDETYVVNQIKEDVCFVSQNFDMDMKASKQKIGLVEYVLPDFTTVKRGYIRGGEAKKGENGNEIDEDDKQILKLCNERFTVPELLFTPIDVGIKQVGIPETIIDSLNSCPEVMHCEMLENIIVIGGSSNFKNFVPRLKKDLRALATDDLEVSLIFPDDSTSYGWYGGKELANSGDLNMYLLTREEYEETGYTPNRKRKDN